MWSVILFQTYNWHLLIAYHTHFHFRFSSISQSYLLTKIDHPPIKAVKLHQEPNERSLVKPGAALISPSIPKALTRVTVLTITDSLPIIQTQKTGILLQVVSED